MIELAKAPWYAHGAVAGLCASMSLAISID
jgi:hypothetical protein